jgi:hypothetical protein
MCGKPHGITSQKMAFFIVTAMKTSNLTCGICNEKWFDEAFKDTD